MKFKPNKMYSATEAAEILEVNPRTIFRGIKANKIPAAKIGRSYAINGMALNDFVGLKSVDVEALKLEKALIDLDLGYQANTSELAMSPFYNLSAGVISGMAKSASSRAEMLILLANYINQIRVARLKPNVELRAKDTFTGEFHRVCRIGYDEKGHVIDLVVWNEDGSTTERTDDPSIEIKPILLNAS